MGTLVTVRRDELKQYLRSALEMEAHEVLGVDNWCGRDDIEWPTDTEVLDLMDHMEARANGNPS